MDTKNQITEASHSNMAKEKLFYTSRQSEVCTRQCVHSKESDACSTTTRKISQQNILHPESAKLFLAIRDSIQFLNIKNKRKQYSFNSGWRKI